MLLLQTYCIPILVLKFCWTNKRYNFYHFINEITKDTKNHGDSAKKLGSTFFASIRRTLGATKPLFSIVYGFLMNCKSRFAEENYRNIYYKSVNLHWDDIFPEVGLLASRQFIGLVKSVNGFSDTEILFIYLWDTYYFGPTLTYFSFPVHCF